MKGKNNIATYYEKEKLYNKKNANTIEKKISYIKKGSSSLFIILVPGYSMTQDMWPTQFIDMLAMQYTVVTYDLRGVGDSKDTGEEHSLVLYADDLSRLIKQLGIQKATIMRNVAVKEALGIWWRLFAASVSELLASSFFHSTIKKENIFSF